MLPVIAHSIIPVQFNSVHFTSINNNLYHLPAVTHRAIYIYIYISALSYFPNSKRQGRQVLSSLWAGHGINPHCSNAAEAHEP